MRVALALALLFVTASIACAESVRGVSGRWYLEGEEDGTYLQYLIDRADDGKYRAEVHLPKECAKYIETGRWRFADGTLYQTAEAVDGVPVPGPEHENSFIITIVDDDHVTTLDTETKITWQVRRAGPDFKFPVTQDCAV